MTKKHKQVKPQKDSFETQADHMRRITELVGKLNKVVGDARKDNVVARFDGFNEGPHWELIRTIRVSFVAAPESAESK